MKKHNILLLKKGNRDKLGIVVLDLNIESQVLKQKRRNPYKHWAAPISLYSVMGTFLK